MVVDRLSDGVGTLRSIASGLFPGCGVGVLSFEAPDRIPWVYADAQGISGYVLGRRDVPLDGPPEPGITRDIPIARFEGDRTVMATRLRHRWSTDVPRAAPGVERLLVAAIPGERAALMLAVPPAVVADERMHVQAFAERLREYFSPVESSEDAPPDSPEIVNVLTGPVNDAADLHALFARLGEVARTTLGHDYVALDLFESPVDGGPVLLEPTGPRRSLPHWRQAMSRQRVDAWRYWLTDNLGPDAGARAQRGRPGGSSMSVALRVDARLLGILHVIRGEVCRFTARETAVAERLARQVAAVLFDYRRSGDASHAI